MIDITFGLAHLDSGQVVTKLVYIPEAISAELTSNKLVASTADPAVEAVYTQDSITATANNDRISGVRHSVVIKAVVDDRKI